MANVPGPFPQRGWSCVGAEQTARVRKENLTNDDWEDMEDTKAGQASTAAFNL